MRIVAIDIEHPLLRFKYLNVTQGGRQIVTDTLICWRAEVDMLPPPLKALIVTSDLQGRENLGRNDKRQKRLLGEVVAEELAFLSEAGDLPPRDQLGVILCGDMFSRPELDRRGGSGDCRPVWKAFRDMARWCCGTAGNHDVFGSSPSEPDFNTFKTEPGIHFLDGQAVSLDNLRIGAVAGIVGNPRRPFRREEPAYVQEVQKVARMLPDILVLHDGPDYQELGLKGWSSVREALEASRPTLVIRGHAHWAQPLVELRNGTQVLNVDAQVAILVPKAVQL